MQTKKTETEIIAEFKKKRTSQIAFSLVLILSMAASVFISEKSHFSIGGLNSRYLTYGVTGFIVLYFVFFLYNWRCPACGKFLGRGMNPGACAKCGVKLQ